MSESNLRRSVDPIDRIIGPLIHGDPVSIVAPQIGLAVFTVLVLAVCPLPPFLGAQSVDPSKPRSIAELSSRMNDNKQVGKFMLESPFNTVTRSGERVMLSFGGIDEIETPFRKVGMSRRCRYLGDSCMTGVIRVTRMEWYAYLWPSERGRFWLCLVYDGGPSFKCFDAISGITNTAPERYGVLVLDGQRYLSQLPISADWTSIEEDDNGSKDESITSCGDSCSGRVEEVVGRRSWRALMDSGFVGHWHGARTHLDLNANGLGAISNVADLTKGRTFYWMVLPSDNKTSLLCLTAKKPTGTQDVATGEVYIIEPESHDRVDCQRILSKGMISFKQGEKIFQKAFDPHR